MHSVTTCLELKNIRDSLGLEFSILMILLLAELDLKLAIFFTAFLTRYCPAVSGSDALIDFLLKLEIANGTKYHWEQCCMICSYSGAESIPKEIQIDVGLCRCGCKTRNHIHNQRNNV